MKVKAGSEYPQRQKLYTYIFHCWMAVGFLKKGGVHQGRDRKYMWGVLYDLEATQTIKNV
jgi:hypothetical protein